MQKDLETINKSFINNIDMINLCLELNPNQLVAKGKVLIGKFIIKSNLKWFKMVLKQITFKKKLKTVSFSIQEKFSKNFSMN